MKSIMILSMISWLISWQADPEDNILIFKKDPAQDWVQIGQVEPGETTFVDTKCRKHQVNSYKLMAFNPNNNPSCSSFSNSVWGLWFYIPFTGPKDTTAFIEDTTRTFVLEAPAAKWDIKIHEFPGIIGISITAECDKNKDGTINLTDFSLFEPADSIYYDDMRLLWGERSRYFPMFYK